MVTVPVNDPRTELAAGQVVVVVGPGLAVPATGKASVASWVGPLEDGVAFYEGLLGC